MNKHTITQALEQSLCSLTSGVSMTRVLKNYYQHTHELKPLLEIAVALQKLYATVPPPKNLERGKQKVLTAVTQQNPPRQAPQRHNPKVRWLPQFLLATLAMVIVCALILMPFGQQVVLAAGDSLPGQILYPIKITGENTYLENAQDPEMKALLAISLMENRIEEMKILADNNAQIPTASITEITRLSYEALEAAAQTPDTTMPEVLNFIVRRIELQITTLDTLIRQSNGNNNSKLVQAQNICMEKQIIAIAASENVKNFRLAYGTGHPERLELPTGGPLGGTITPTAHESTPQDHNTAPDGIPTAPDIQPEHSPEPPEIHTLLTPHLTSDSITQTIENLAQISITTTLTDTPTPTATLTSTATLTPTDTTSDTVTLPPATPPGLENRPTIPPGLEKQPTLPPGMEQRPETPPGQDNTANDNNGNDNNDNNSNNDNDNNSNNGNDNNSNNGQSDKSNKQGKP
ncbi:MAG: hypothetical protein JW981_05670 [Anaerolineae bacterium]|nr:hypothetical protein [Anaerolineae bacterium]